MAADDDLFSDLEEMDDSDSEGGAVDEPAPAAPVEAMPGDEDASSVIAEAAAELQELGVEVPTGGDPLEFLKHFLTAVKTHKSTKALTNGEGDNLEGDIMPTAPAAPEPMPVAMSLRVQRLEKELADERLNKTLAKVDALVSKGQAEKVTADEWKKTLTARRLSLVGTREDVPLASVLAEIKNSSRNPEGTFWTPDRRRERLSLAREEPAPEGLFGDDPDGEEPDEHVMRKLTGGKYKGKKKAE